MSIAVKCPCGRAYRIRAEHAGKMFRCKACGERLRVPRRVQQRRPATRRAKPRADDFGTAPTDDWDLGSDDFGMNDDYGMDDDYGTADFPATPRPRRKRRSERRRQGMPAPVIVAMVGEGILVPINILSLIGNLAVQNFGAVLACIWRIAMEVACIVGFTKRQKQARWASLILSALGAVVWIIIFVLLLRDSEYARQRISPDEKTFVIVFMLLQMAIFCMLIVSLMMPSAIDYFRSGKRRRRLSR